jgi:hypothetical protein
VRYASDCSGRHSFPPDRRGAGPRGTAKVARQRSSGWLREQTAARLPEDDAGYGRTNVLRANPGRGSGNPQRPHGPRAGWNRAARQLRRPEIRRPAQSTDGLALEGRNGSGQPAFHTHGAVASCKVSGRGRGGMGLRWSGRIVCPRRSSDRRIRAVDAGWFQPGKKALLISVSREETRSPRAACRQGPSLTTPAGDAATGYAAKSSTGRSRFRSGAQRPDQPRQACELWPASIGRTTPPLTGDGDVPVSGR